MPPVDAPPFRDPDIRLVVELIGLNAAWPTPAATTDPPAALMPMLRATPSPATAPSIIGITRINANGMNAARRRIADPWIMPTFPPVSAAPFISDAPVAKVTAIASFEKISATAVSVALRAYERVGPQIRVAMASGANMITR